MSQIAALLDPTFFNREFSGLHGIGMRQAADPIQTDDQGNPIMHMVPDDLLDFDASYYLHRYQDVAASEFARTPRTALDHYARFGKGEGRSPNASTPEVPAFLSVHNGPFRYFYADLQRGDAYIEGTPDNPSNYYAAQVYSGGAANVWHLVFVDDTGGTIHAIVAADPDTGRVKPLVNPSKQVVYQPGQSWFQQWAPILSLAALAATFAGIPAMIGEAVLGTEAAAASPLLSETIGKAAMGAVTSGGDVAKVVTNAAAGLTGGYVGDVAGTGLDSVEVGKVAQAVTTAAMTGGNIQQAAALAAAGAAAGAIGKQMDTTTDTTDYTFTASTTDTTAAGYDPTFGDITLADIGINVDPVTLAESLDTNETALTSAGVDISTVVPDNSGTMYTQTGDYVAMPADVYASSFYVDDQGNVRSADNRITIPAADAANMTSEEIANTCFKSWYTEEGQTVNSQTAPDSRPADLPPAANQTKVPNITDQASTWDKLLKTAVSIGASIKAITSGTFRPTYSTSPYGTARVQAVGVPVQRADGSVVTNNGNGTQTIQYPDGRVQTVSTSYSGSVFGGLFAGINTQTLMIGGAALLVVALLAKRK